MPDERAAGRFEAAREELARGLASLLGRGAESAVYARDPDEAVRVWTELVASHHAAEPDEWAMAAREWPAGESAACVAMLERVNRNVGSRRVWLVAGGREPQAVALSSELVLDNPLGFAGVAGEGAPELRLLDRDVTAGLWLARRDHVNEGLVEHSWRLEVWGEPWLSAATRAARGIG